MKLENIDLVKEIIEDIKRNEEEISVINKVIKDVKTFCNSNSQFTLRFYENKTQQKSDVELSIVKWINVDEQDIYTVLYCLQSIKKEKNKTLKDVLIEL